MGQGCKLTPSKSCMRMMDKITAGTMPFEQDIV